MTSCGFLVEGTLPIYRGSNTCPWAQSPQIVGQAEAEEWGVASVVWGPSSPRGSPTGAHWLWGRTLAGILARNSQVGSGTGSRVRLAQPRFWIAASCQVESPL